MSSLLHNPISRVLQRLHASQPIRISDRVAQKFAGAGLGGLNVFEDGNVNYEGADGERQQQENAVAEISELACVTGRTLCGKVSKLDDVIKTAKCVDGVVVAVSNSCLAVGPGSEAHFCARGEVIRAEDTTIIPV